MNMKNFTKIFYLIIAILIFSSCSQKQNIVEPKRTIIAGVVENFSDNANALIINYCNPVSDERNHAQNLIISNGQFHFEHEYVFAQNLTIRFANKFINLFVHPGDSVFINIDANKIPDNFGNAVTFSGDNAALNKELFLWVNYWYDINNQNFLQIDSDTSPEKLLAAIKQNFDQTENSINAYSKETNISNFLKKWAYVDHKFVTANYILDYSHPEANRWDIFTNTLFDVFNENNFQTMFFQYHLTVCTNALIQTDPELSRLFSEEDYVPAVRLAIKRLFEKAPQGTVRDFMLFKLLEKPVKEMPELYDSIPDIKTVFSQDFFNKELAKLAGKNKKTIKVSETESQLNGIFYMTNGTTEELPDVKLLNFLMEKYKDKVLYIDIWATWCGPCIEEFKSTPSLHKYFKGKDVVFVNLCLSSKFENWEPSIKKHNIGGENYFLSDNAAQLFRAEHKIPGYPYYLLIDKNGKIYNPTPRPSNLESAIQKIESCLN
jgi:thiol-disulfide isomerase/thioredoxin